MPYLLETPQFYIEESSQKINLARNANYFFSTGAMIKLTESLFFKPLTMIRYIADLPVSIDINFNFLYRDFIETGVSYRYENSVSALFAVIVNKKYRIGYAYDYKLSTLGRNFSTHEIIFHLDLNLKRNSRWFLGNACYF